MNGIELLAEAARIAPDTVRVMLTGESDQRAAIAAVNEGAVFRFLTKPCDSETLRATIRAGIEQHRLVTAEKELLGKTVGGAIRVLTDLLALVNPVAFGQAGRVRRIVRQIIDELDSEVEPELELEAMLSQIGCVTIPESVLQRTLDGATLSASEAGMYYQHPAIGAGLLAKIPRLEHMAGMVEHQHDRHDGSGGFGGLLRGETLPFGARILKVALDFDMLVTRGVDAPQALRSMRDRASSYDPQLLEALEAVYSGRSLHNATQVGILDLRPGMLLAQDIEASGGTILMASSQEVTWAALAKVRNHLDDDEIRGDVAVEASQLENEQQQSA
jgi:response regulator RpfG family c-di-GMP phosphodiesterase